MLLNCVGPYRDYGEPVVKACIEAHTDYIDLCGTSPDPILCLITSLIQIIGEPAFIEKMHLKYHDIAIQLRITICHAAVYFYS